MFDVYLLKFNKNRRTTEQPNITGVTPTSAKLKAPCSILSPILEIQVSPSTQGNWVDGNYAYIPDFKRYYFITNIVLDGNIINIYCTVDELATWKTAIRSSTQYVLRAASTFNGFVKDGKYPLLAKTPDHSGTYGTQVTNPLLPPSTSYGVFIVGVVSPDISLTGGVTYYAMSYLALYGFMQQLFTLTTQWGNQGQDLADALKESITDPMQYVVSIMWLPFTVNDFVNRNFVSAGTTSVKVGYWSMTVPTTVYPFTASILPIEFTNLITLAIPMHPQTAARGNYMNFAPFSRYYLSFYPFCGIAELDSTLVGGKGGIYCVYTVDLRTGRGIMSVCTEYNGSDYSNWTPKSPIRVFEAQVGVNIPLATIHTEMSWNPLTYAQNLAGAISSAYGGFDQVVPTWIDRTLAKLNMSLAPAGSENQQSGIFADSRKTLESTPDMSDVLDEAVAMNSTCEMIGSQGTMSFNFRMPVAAWGNFFEAASDDNTKNGRPVCQSISLSALSGFVQCDQPRISAAGMTLQEQQAIETMMAHGIYIA